jgi:hypothetical protein
VIWFDCAKGFEVTNASQTPKINHEMFLDGPGGNQKREKRGTLTDFAVQLWDPSQNRSASPVCYK